MPNEKDNVENVEYLENTKGLTDDFLTCWDKEEGETAASKRKRHIIIFNPEQRDVVNFSFEFDGRLKGKGLKYENCVDNELQTSGKTNHC